MKAAVDILIFILLTLIAIPYKVKKLQQAIMCKRKNIKLYILKKSKSCNMLFSKQNSHDQSTKQLQ